MSTRQDSLAKAQLRLNARDSLAVALERVQEAMTAITSDPEPGPPAQPADRQVAQDAAETIAFHGTRADLEATVAGLRRLIDSFNKILCR